MGEKRAFHLHNGKSGAALAIKVQPKSSRNEIAGVMDDGTIKIRLTAPPVDGEANKALIKFLSKIIGVPASKIDIVAGEKGRKKLVSVLDRDAKYVQAKILDNLKK